VQGEVLRLSMWTHAEDNVSDLDAARSGVKILFGNANQIVKPSMYDGDKCIFVR
jgi:hypothetical protein